MSQKIITTPHSADRAQLAFYVETLLADARAAIDAENQSMNCSQTIAVYTKDNLEQFKDFWGSARSDGSTNAQSVLKAFEKHPTPWRCSPAPADLAFAEFERRFPNFSEPIGDMRRAAALARLGVGRPLTLSPMLLDGTPGIGKSRFASELASLLGVPMRSFSMAVSSAAFSLGGLNSQYASGGPGLLVRSVADLGAPDPVIVIDEIDKAPRNGNSDPTSPLYELLEMGTAARFIDEGLMMPLDLSGIRWVCTCNDAEQIDEPLRSRLVHYQIPAPTPEQMRAIASTTYRDVIASGALSSHFDPDLPEHVRDELVALVPRDLARVIQTALGAAALDRRSSLRLSDLPSARKTGRPRIGFC